MAPNTVTRAAITEALDDPDPWHGFTTYIERVCAMQAADRGLADLLTLAVPTAKAWRPSAPRPGSCAGFPTARVVVVEDQAFGVAASGISMESFASEGVPVVAQMPG